MSLRRIQPSLRHDDPSMTRRYILQRERGETAEAVNNALFQKREVG